MLWVSLIRCAGAAGAASFRAETCPKLCVLGGAGAALGPTVAKIVERSSALQAAAHPTTREKLLELLRSMNSYYSNLIEGQGTHPRNIERALKDDYSQKPATARLQRIAMAHLDAERELENQVSLGAEPLTGAFAARAHRAMYSRLSAEDRRTQDGAVIEPGAFRSRRVVVGRHEPPAAEALSAFLARYDSAYTAVKGTEQRVIAIACAHHRLAWIHPFEDGNGRADRLAAGGT